MDSRSRTFLVTFFFYFMLIGCTKKSFSGAEVRQNAEITNIDPCTNPEVRLILLSGGGTDDKEDRRRAEEHEFIHDLDYAEKKFRALNIKNLRVARFPFNELSPAQHRDKLFQYLQSIKTEVRECDYTVLIYSGHGGPQNLNIVTNPFESEDEDPTGALTIRNFAREIPGKKVLLFDSCGSGQTAEYVMFGMGQKKIPIPNTVVIGTTIGPEKAYYVPFVKSFVKRYVDALRKSNCDLETAYYEMKRGVNYFSEFFDEKEKPIISTGSFYKSSQGSFRFPCR